MQYLIDPSLLTQSTSINSLAPIDLSNVGNLFQSGDNQRPQFIPLDGDIGSSIARQVLHSFGIHDGQSENLNDGGEIVKVIKSKKNQGSTIVDGKLGQQLPKGAVLIYRDGDEGDESDEGETTFSTLKSGNVEAEEEPEGDDSDSDSDSDKEKTTVVRSKKPGRLMVKRIVRNKDGELTAIDWVEDKGHKKHGWKNLYHKEEWGDTQEKHDLLRDKGWKKRFKDDHGEDSKSIAGQLLAKRRKSKKSLKKKKKKNRNDSDEENSEKNDQHQLSNGYRIPQILWNYLSRQNGQESPIEELKISKVA